MNWAGLSAVLVAVVVSLVANEMCDLSPWLAQKLLRRASRWEATDETEATLILAEQLEYLNSIPGRITKLAWAAGRMRFGLRFVFTRAKEKLRKIPAWQANLIGYPILAYLSLSLVPRLFGDPAVKDVVQISALALLWAGHLLADGRNLKRRLMRRRNRSK